MNEKSWLPGWISKRSAGALLHLTSLPSSTGIGNLGRGAYEFIDFLSIAGFSFWQTCPVGPTGYGDSPYQVFSSSAGNPYLIDWNPLVNAGLLSKEELQPLLELDDSSVDYGSLYERFYPIARLAHSRFRKDYSCLSHCYGEYLHFHSLHSHWLEPYAFFQTCKELFSSSAWWEWPADHKDRMKVSENSSKFHFHVFLQYLFRGQWKKLHDYAEAKRISLIGDLPIYAAPDSSEVWHTPELFQVNAETGVFIEVAGVPPDYFNEDGQYWGNPLYRWDLHQKSGYKWWMDRLSEQLQLFDVLRIDHFRGFHDYWSIPSSANAAKSGSWKKGPGLSFWKTMRKKFPSMPFLAEDLGLISDQVRRLRDSAGLPGMAVLQFAFDGSSENLYLPHNLKPSLVLYTGTHDNDTTMGWYEKAGEEVRGNFRSYLNVDGNDAAWDMLRTAYRSVSPLVVVPVQDLLNLGSEARLNEPGYAMGNWKWRLRQDQLRSLASNDSSYLREQAKITGRLPAGLP